MLHIRHGSLRIGFLGALCLLASLASGQSVERWFVMELNGQRAGWMRSLDTTKDGQITSEAEQDLTIGRGAAAVHIKLKTQFVETEEGKPVSMRLEQTLGAVKEVRDYTFGEAGVTVKSTQFGKTTEEVRPSPEGTWLPPAAAQRYVKQLLAGGADKIVLRTVDPTIGLEVLTYTRSEFEKTDLVVHNIEKGIRKCLHTECSRP